MKRVKKIMLFLVVVMVGLGNVRAQDLTLSFDTRTSRASQKNSLKVLVSTDFNGKYDKQSVVSATWVDVTDKAQLAQGVVKVNSGNIDLSKFSKNKHMFIAFKYVASKDSRYIQPGWGITDLKLIHNFATESIIKDPRKAWHTVSVLNAVNTPKVNWVLNVGGLILKADKLNVDPVEQWVITKKIDLQRSELIP